MSDETMLTEDDVLADDPNAVAWTPPEGVNRHAGEPLEPGTDFFAAPPPEIGEIITADSTLRVNKRPMKAATRLVVAGLAGWAVAMVVYLITSANHVEGELIWQILAFLPTALIVWFVTSFSHTCSYVGKLGVARVKCKGNRDRCKPFEMFLFEDASELRTGQTRHYHNGVYTGTNYYFHWTDAAGNRRFKLSGTYRGEKKPPKAKDPFHFATMAEYAWSMYLFDLAGEELKERGGIRFRLGGSDSVTVGPGFLDLDLKGKPIRLTAEEIGAVTIDAGLFKIKRTDAVEGWFSSKGVYQFGYAADGQRAIVLAGVFAAGRGLNRALSSGARRRPRRSSSTSERTFNEAFTSSPPRRLESPGPGNWRLV